MKKIISILLVLAMMLSLTMSLASCDAGEQGPQGEQGIQGEKGDPGEPGEPGETGAPGATGAQGPQGEKGDTGAQGPQGDKGDTGAQGEKGDKGDKGDTGAQGDKGDKGDKGDTGATIEKIEYDDQGRLVITLTDGTVLAPVELPEKEEHVHIFEEWATVIAPACERNGLAMRFCTECHYTESKLIAATGHTEVTDPAVAPTCTRTGLTEGKYCSTCGKILVAQETVDALGHSLGDWYVTKAPTATENGEKRRDCERCGHYTEKELIVPEPFSITNSNREQIGFTGEVGEKLVIPATFQSDDGAWYRVTSIEMHAFNNCSSLTSAVIPDSVTSIGLGSFSGCSSLESITLPFVGNQVNSDGYLGYIFGASSYASSKRYVPAALKTVVITGDSNITSYAFYDCSGLTSITIPDGVTSIGDFAFYCCAGLTSMTIPDSVTIIDHAAFYYCTGLTSIVIPDKVVSIGRSAFSGTGLTSINIPDSVTSIGDQVFSDCDDLTSITVSEGNPVYHSEGNCLIETASKTLVKGCNSSVIPNDGSVISIGFAAFYDCTSLTSITIPKSVTSIGDFAFNGCSGLTSITFNGTAVQWNAVTKGYGWDYGTGNYTIYCLPYITLDDETVGMRMHSFDSFFVNGQMYFPEDGGAGDKLTAQGNKVILEAGETDQSVDLRGWIGFTQAIESFGYYIDDPYAQTFGEFKTETEDGVISAAGEFASRFRITVPLTGLTSGTEHKVGFLVKLADGTVVRLREEITVVVPSDVPV